MLAGAGVLGLAGWSNDPENAAHSAYGASVPGRKQRNGTHQGMLKQLLAYLVNELVIVIIEVGQDREAAAVLGVHLGWVESDPHARPRQKDRYFTSPACPELPCACSSRPPCEIAGDEPSSVAVANRAGVPVLYLCESAEKLLLGRRYRISGRTHFQHSNSFAPVRVRQASDGVHGVPPRMAEGSSGEPSKPANEMVLDGCCATSLYPDASDGAAGVNRASGGVAPNARTAKPSRWPARWTRPGLPSHPEGRRPTSPRPPRAASPAE
jgi:hypothetical protein